MQSESMLSCVRIKPLANKEEEVSCIKFEEKSVLLLKMNEKYNFEMVFDEQSKNEEIFGAFCKNLIDDAFLGINTCIFAYGQTSSGKTFTMKGTNENPGLIPKTISYVFNKLQENNEISVEVKVSYLEIYNETINDLLKKDNSNLDIRENLAKGIYIQNLSEIHVRNERNALEYFHFGENLRKFGETSLNEESSRSHTVFSLHFETRNKERPDKINFSVVNLVDLAGSEGVSKAKTEGIRKKEGANINKSLLALSTVISKLSQKDGLYINFRDSKLTRLLQPCLGGNSRTAVICTINPHLTNIPETINTLKFGMNAGVIKNYIKINERERYEKSSIGKFSVEKNIFDLTLKENNELKIELNKYEEQLNSLLEKIETSEKKQSEMQEKYNVLVSEIEFIKNENQNLKLNKDIIQKENENLRKNNRDLMRIVKEFKEIEKQSQSFGILQKKLQKTEEEKLNLEKENNSIKENFTQINKKLIEDLKAKETKLNEIIEENKNLSKIAKEFNRKNKICKTTNNNINSLNIAKLPPIEQKNIFDNKENKNNNNLNVSNLSFFKDDHQIKIIKRPAEPNKNETLNFEDNLENLELTSNLSAKIFQKNRILNHINEKILGLEKIVHIKDDKIFELNNELLYYKNIYGNNLSLTSFDFPESNVSNSISICKKKKMDDYSLVQKKVKCSPDKDELKRENKYLECKNRNFERQLIKKKQLEAENFKRIEFLSNQAQSLTNKLEEKCFNFENLLEL